MPNPELEQLIARKLQTGITHPGDPAAGVKPHEIVLPFKPNAGMPKEMSDLLHETTKQLAEAIVHLIETEGGVEMVPQDEARTLRHAAGDIDLADKRVPVYCRCDKATPLMVLSVRDPGHIAIDGSVLLKQLHKREAAHPHRVIEASE